MQNRYDGAYAQKEYYWGISPSKYAIELLQIMPPEKPLKLLDIGCGEGRNAVFFARNGYDVTAFDLSPLGVEKTKELAQKTGVELEVFEANVLEYRLDRNYDILFATGILHYITENLRATIFNNYKEFTNRNGIHVFNVFVEKPFIQRAPDHEETAQRWISGELFTHYHDWKIEICNEVMFDCKSSGIPHKHAMDLMIARKP